MHLQALQLSHHSQTIIQFSVSHSSHIVSRIDSLTDSLPFSLSPSLTVPARVGPGRTREPPWPVAPLQEEEPRISGGHTHLAILVSTAAVSQRTQGLCVVELEEL